MGGAKLEVLGTSHPYHIWYVRASTMCIGRRDPGAQNHSATMTMTNDVDRDHLACSLRKASSDCFIKR